MDPLPSVNKVFSLITQDEKQRAVSSQVVGRTPESVAFAVKNGTSHSNRSYAPRNAHLKCDRCNITGHTTDSCRAHLKCDYCGFKGHTVDACRKLKRANFHGDKKGNSGFSSKAHYAEYKPDNSTSESPSYHLTADQYHNLLALIDQTKTTSMANQVSSASTISNLSGPTLGEDDWDGR
ncbi:uncharacterized protein LOC120013773 [Tripterygium wilfordii]|uniref:uncharacterized protein LOC120013773 n=1 Tax=Tripterygium wilfordii TaxID=458696 RepID=UPI0018F839BF|nr:uncharacterized protein LOC120013773 [Tripterygium wilfordii]